MHWIQRSSRWTINYNLEYNVLLARNILWMKSRWNYTVKMDLGNMLLWGSRKTQEWAMILFSRVQRWAEKLWGEKSLFLSCWILNSIRLSFIPGWWQGAAWPWLEQWSFSPGAVDLVKTQAKHANGKLAKIIVYQLWKWKRGTLVVLTRCCWLGQGEVQKENWRK